MPPPAIEVAEIFRGHGTSWRDTNRGHVSLGQLKVMSAIEHRAILTELGYDSETIDLVVTENAI
jgi:hypothetical protein